MSKSQKTESVAGKIWVSRHYGKHRDDEHEQVDLEVRTFDVEPAYVKAGYGLTMNLGNYESARCDCGVTLPCYVEEIPEALKKAWDIAESEIQKQRKEVTGK
jgi:hypothetical protein